MERRGPRGGFRSIYIVPEAFLFHLDEIVKVDRGPRGTEITIESSPPWGDDVIRAADLEIKSEQDFNDFIEQRSKRPADGPVDQEGGLQLGDRGQRHLMTEKPSSELLDPAGSGEVAEKTVGVGKAASRNFTGEKTGRPMGERN